MEKENISHKILIAFNYHSTAVQVYIPEEVSHSQRECRLLFTLTPGKFLIISSGKSVCVEDVVVHLELAAPVALLLVVSTCTWFISFITWSYEGGSYKIKTDFRFTWKQHFYKYNVSEQIKTICLPYLSADGNELHYSSTWKEIKLSGENPDIAHLSWKKLICSPRSLGGWWKH